MIGFQQLLYQGLVNSHKMRHARKLSSDVLLVSIAPVFFSKTPRVTHSYLLQGEEQPQCVGCDAPLTVRDFLLECDDFAHVRNNCFHVDNMKELFKDILIVF